MGEASVNRNGRRAKEIETRPGLFPNEILEEIISFLPCTKLAIRTGIICKDWKFFWKNSNALIFDFSNMDESFHGIVLGLIRENNCKKLKKLQLVYDARLVPDPSLTLKIACAIDKKVEELILHFNSNQANILYNMPEILVRNNQLVKLDILKCCLKEENMVVELPSLKELRMGMKTQVFTVLEKMVEGSPNLDMLQVSELLIDQKGYLYSLNLKRIIFVDLDLPGSYISLERSFLTIRIDCPRLEEFRVRVSEGNRNFVNLPKETMRSLLTNCQSLKVLEMSKFCHTSSLSISSNSLEEINLGYNRAFLSFDIHYKCPKLRSIHLCHLDLIVIAQGVNAYEDCNELRYVKVSGLYIHFDESMMAFIRNTLQVATKLKKVSIRIEDAATEFVQTISNQIENMPRSSLNAVVEIVGSGEEEEAEAEAEAEEEEDGD